MGCGAFKKAFIVPRRASCEQPDQYYGFQCPDNGPNVFDIGQVTWPATARYYDKNLKLTEIVVREYVHGTLYNGLTGKSVQLDVDDLNIFRYGADGVSGTYIGNDFSASRGERTLAFSRGIVQYNYGSLLPLLLIDIGHHPLDDLYGHDDFSGLLPICSALK